MKDMLKSRIVLEAEVKKNAKVQSDNWFNAGVVTDVQAVNVGVLEAAEDGEAKADENSVKIFEVDNVNKLEMFHNEEFFNNVGDPTM